MKAVSNCTGTTRVTTPTVSSTQMLMKHFQDIGGLINFEIEEYLIIELFSLSGLLADKEALLPGNYFWRGGR